MNISDAMLGAVTPLKSGMPFQSRRLIGPLEASVPNLASFFLICSSIAFTASSFSFSQLIQPSSSSLSSFFVGPTIVSFRVPTLKEL